MLHCISYSYNSIANTKNGTIQKSVEENPFVENDLLLKTCYFKFCPYRHWQSESDTADFPQEGSQESKKLTHLPVLQLHLYLVVED